MAAAYRLRLDLTFGQTGSASTANAGKVPYLASGTSTAVGLASSARLTLRPTDTFVLASLPSDGGKQILQFTLDPSQGNCVQGYWNTRPGGLPSFGVSGYVEIDFNDERGKQLSVAINGHGAFYASQNKLEITLILGPPTRA